MRRIDTGSVERSFDVAVSKGLARSWRKHPDGGYVVDLAGWGPEHAKTNGEAYFLAVGLATAGRNGEDVEDSPQESRP